MAMLKKPTVIDDAKGYLYRLGCNPDTTLDPTELIRDLVKECETLTKANKQLNEKLVDVAADIEPQLALNAG